MIPTAVPARLVIPLLFLTLPLAAQALCTSDGAVQPAAVLERFINADCATCWMDAATPKPSSPQTLVLDWVVPGRMGDDAPLSAVASNEAVQRLQALRRRLPDQSDAVTTRRAGNKPPLRLAQGGAFNDYVGASIELDSPGPGAWSAWLLLVEKLPAGTEGSPVPRNLVRNVFRPEWGQALARAPRQRAETRAMQIHEGAQADRLRLVALLHDARGRIRAISQTECSE